MPNLKKKIAAAVIAVGVVTVGCVTPQAALRTANKSVPEKYPGSGDTANSAAKSWREFFQDDGLAALIDSALHRNQELNIALQEIEVARSEVRARKGEYLPSVGIGAAGEIEKVGRYTSQGANDANTDIMPGRPFPEPLGNVGIGLAASWEVDVWKRLRNARKAAYLRYLASVEGRNFMITNLVSEIAESYYELEALDNQLIILDRNISIQQNALSIMRQEKLAAKVSEMAVRKFEAEVYSNQSRRFEILQHITETENRINFLTGRAPLPVSRNASVFLSTIPDTVFAGVPSQLLGRRPDIRQAERELAAAQLDVKSARALFYPSLRLTGGIGFNAFDPAFLLHAPESLVYSLAGDLLMPLVNRNVIKANYTAASHRQLQWVFKYEQVVLNAYYDVANLSSRQQNLKKSFDRKNLQVESLNSCVNISFTLFRAARADYMEVLMTQRDLLEATFELVETKLRQAKTRVALYRALGGGWN